MPKKKATEVETSTTQMSQPPQTGDLSIQNEVETLRKQLVETREELLKAQMTSDGQKAILEPEAGPGPECEAWKVHMGEAWQLKQDEFGNYEPVPAGYKGTNRGGNRYIVRPEMLDARGFAEKFISNCRSKWTKEYEYKLRKPAGMGVNDEPPKGKAYLCSTHAKIFVDKELNPEVKSETKPKE